jgi:hypothetical protein
METLLKKELHHLIDDCDNDDVLLQVKKIIENKTNDNWWNELNATQQLEIAQLLNEPDEKDTINLSAFLKATEKWGIK